MDSNEAEELGGAYVLTVDELGCTGLWDSVKDVGVPVLLRSSSLTHKQS
jgi:hypothetical protein